MHRFCAIGIQEIHRFAQLRAANDRIVHKQQILILNQLVNRNLLHFRDLIALRLARGHKRARPCGCIFDKRAGEWNAAFICITDRMRRSGIRYAADIIDVLGVARFLVMLRHDPAVSVAHLLDIYAFIRRIRIAVITPEKRTNAHLFTRFGKPAAFAVRQLHDFARAKLRIVLAAELFIRERFKRRTHAVLALTDDHRQTSETVARNDDRPVLLQDQERRAALNLLLREANTFNKIALLIDQCRGKLR